MREATVQTPEASTFSEQRDYSPGSVEKATISNLITNQQSSEEKEKEEPQANPFASSQHTATTMQQPTPRNQDSAGHDTHQHLPAQRIADIREKAGYTARGNNAFNGKLIPPQLPASSPGFTPGTMTPQSNSFSNSLNGRSTAAFYHANTSPASATVEAARQSARSAAEYASKKMIKSYLGRNSGTFRTSPAAMSSPISAQIHQRAYLRTDNSHSNLPLQRSRGSQEPEQHKHTQEETRSSSADTAVFGHCRASSPQKPADENDLLRVSIAKRHGAAVPVPAPQRKPDKPKLASVNRGSGSSQCPAPDSPPQLPPRQRNVSTPSPQRGVRISKYGNTAMDAHGRTAGYDPVAGLNDDVPTSSRFTETLRLSELERRSESPNSRKELGESNYSRYSLGVSSSSGRNRYWSPESLGETRSFASSPPTSSHYLLPGNYPVEDRFLAAVSAWKGTRSKAFLEEKARKAEGSNELTQDSAPGNHFQPDNYIQREDICPEFGASQDTQTRYDSEQRCFRAANLFSQELGSMSKVEEEADISTPNIYAYSSRSLIEESKRENNRVMPSIYSNSYSIADPGNTFDEQFSGSGANQLHSGGQCTGNTQHEVVTTSQSQDSALTLSDSSSISDSSGQLQETSHLFSFQETPQKAPYSATAAAVAHTDSPSHLQVNGKTDAQPNERPTGKSVPVVRFSLDSLRSQRDNGRPKLQTRPLDHISEK